ncbi:MAG: FAD-dependent oxidoreductase, partial [Klebsiella oxytoca]|nr:FAD-dependent oxidoreductase [Klebsiella oxytoca]
MTRQLVIIGNGMAATRLAQALVERDAQRFSITIIGDEPGQAYNRIQLSPVLGAEKTAGETRLLPETWYQRHNVKVRAGETVTAVDIHARTLQTTAGVVSWDELVFATGSLPFVPPLPGITQPHVFAFRTLADVEGILAIDGPAVVIGGGVLGVEAAAALRRYGDSVTLLHRGSGLMEQQIDAFAGEQLQMLLAERGIRCVMELATAQPGVSAIGECCEIDGRTWGLVAPCLRQAEVLAARLCATPGEDFCWQDSGTRLKVSGIELFSAGELRAAEQDESCISWDPLDRHYRRLLLRDGKLRGVLLLGDCSSAAPLTALLGADAPAPAEWLFDPSSTMQPRAAGKIMMTKPVLVLVGHGMVGHHFLEQCIDRRLHQRYRIVVFCEERYAAYDRVHLTEYFTGRSAESLSLVEGDFFAQHGIELRLNESVASIDREARVVRDAFGHETHWDKLVLATGS